MNVVESISDSDFNSTLKIASINLNNNLLKANTISGRAFKHLTLLKTLKLSHSHFNVSLLAKNQLTELYLSFSTVRCDVVDLSSYLKKLDHINLEQTSLLNCSLADFIFNSRLFSINFSNNNLTGLYRMFYNGFTVLDKLELSHVELDAMERIPFKEFYSLKKLDLSSNRLTYLNSSSFSSLRSLEYLDLSANRISLVYGDIFSFSSSYEYINLEKNKLFQLKETPFDMINLKLINLSNNYLSAHPNFVNALKLAEIHCTNNNISRVTRIRSA